MTGNLAALRRYVEYGVLFLTNNTVKGSLCFWIGSGGETAALHVFSSAGRLVPDCETRPPI